MFESGASHSKLELRSRTSLPEMLREPDVMFSGPFRGMATDCTSQPHRYYPLLYAGNFRLTTIDKRSVCEYNGICPVSICGVVTHLDALQLRPRIHTSAISVDHCLKLPSLQRQFLRLNEASINPLELRLLLQKQTEDIGSTAASNRGLRRN